MNIDQAHKILDEVIAGLQLNRRDHYTLQQALQLLYATAKNNQEVREIQKNEGTE